METSSFSDCFCKCKCTVNNKIHSVISNLEKHLTLICISRKRILGDPGAVSWVGRKGTTKVFKHRWKSPWVLTLTGPFPNGQANAGSRLGTKNALYYYTQLANSISWVLFMSSYTTAIDSITAFLAHAPKKCTQSGNIQFDISSPFQNTIYLKTKDTFPKITSLSLQQVFTLALIMPL